MEKMEKYDWKNKNILILEDDMVSLRLFKEYFYKYSNANLIFITDISNIIERIDNINKIDMIITDVVFPSGSILPYLKKIKNHTKVPIIVQSAFVLDSDYLYYIDNNIVYDWVNKPIDFKKLFKNVDVVLNK